MIRGTMFAVLTGFVIGLAFGCSSSTTPEVFRGGGKPAPTPDDSTKPVDEPRPIGQDDLPAPKAGDSSNSSDAPEPIGKDGLPTAEAKLADLEKAVAAKEKEVADLKTQMETLRRSTTAAKGSKDKVYRTPEDLLADMPKEAFPKAGPEGGIERAAARRWVATHLVFQTLEWTATVTGVTITGDGPYKVVVDTDAGFAAGRCLIGTGSNGVDLAGLPFGGSVSLGGQACQVIADSAALKGELSYYCTGDEAKQILAMKNKTVTLRAAIKGANVGDEDLVFRSNNHQKDRYRISFTREQEVRRLPIGAWTTMPELDGFLPRHDIGGGWYFPSGTFTKYGKDDLTLHLAPGKATVIRGKREEVAWMTDPFKDWVYFHGPYAEKATVTSHSYNWNYTNRVLALDDKGDTEKKGDMDKQRAALLGGKWKLKE